MPDPPQTALRKAILKTLPATLTLGEDSIYVRVVWGNELPRSVAKPVWWANISSVAPVQGTNRRYHNESPTAGTVTAESILFTSGDLYSLVAEQDIVAISQVKATVGGVANTILTPGVDYDKGDKDADGFYDSVKWLTGGRKPDTGTNFTVSYTHYLIQQKRTHVKRAIVTVRAITGPLEIGDGKDLNGDGGATQQYRPDEVLEAMAALASTWYEANLAPALEAVGIKLNSELGSPGSNGIGGSAVGQQPFTFNVLYEDEVTLSTVRAARHITHTETVLPG